MNYQLTPPQSPPHIHTIIKNYLDLFSKPVPESRIQALVYEDDKQIAYLSVKYSFSSIEPKIHATFTPFRDFIYGLVFAKEILGDKYERYLKLENLKCEFGDEFGSFDDDQFDDALEAYYDMRRYKEQNIQAYGTDRYARILAGYQMLAQERYLKFSKLRISDLYYLFQASGLIDDDYCGYFPELKETVRLSSKGYANSVIKFPARINLPRIPLTKGDTTVFKTQLRELLRDYRDNKMTLMKDILYLHHRGDIRNEVDL